MEPGTLIREYLLLGLRFDRVEEGYVDSFTGDRRFVAPSNPSPRQTRPSWPVRPTACWPSCRRAPATASTRRAPTTSAPTCARWRAPAASSRARMSASSTRCEAYFDVHIAKGDPEQYRQAHRQARRGPRRQRPARRPDVRPTATGRRSRPNGSRKSIHAFSSALRDRVRAEFPLPDTETITYEVVTDKPWSGFNYYLGDYRSTVAVNADLKQQMSSLPRLVAHESYPGHHTEHCRKEAGLVAGQGPCRADASSWSTPRSA